jgi:hypothetical protein
MKPERQRALSPPDVKPPPHPNDAPRRDPGSIHNAVLNGVPARMARSNYAGISPVAGNASGRLNFDQHHPLPDVPWPKIK